MKHLLSTTALIAGMAFGGAAFAQSTAEESDSLLDNILGDAEALSASLSNVSQNLNGIDGTISVDTARTTNSMAAIIQALIGSNPGFGSYSQVNANVFGSDLPASLLAVLAPLTLELGNLSTTAIGTLQSGTMEGTFDASGIVQKVSADANGATTGANMLAETYGGIGGPLAMQNISVNSGMIEGQVDLKLDDVKTKVGNVATTAIGALQSGGLAASVSGNMGGVTESTSDLIAALVGVGEIAPPPPDPGPGPGPDPGPGPTPPTPGEGEPQYSASLLDAILGDVTVLSASLSNVSQNLNSIDGSITVATSRTTADMAAIITALKGQNPGFGSYSRVNAKVFSSDVPAELLAVLDPLTLELGNLSTTAIGTLQSGTMEGTFDASGLVQRVSSDANGATTGASLLAETYGGIAGTLAMQNISVNAGAIDGSVALTLADVNSKVGTVATTAIGSLQSGALEATVSGNMGVTGKTSALVDALVGPRACAVGTAWDSTTGYCQPG